MSRNRRSRVTPGQRRLMALAAVLFLAVVLTLVYRRVVHPPQQTAPSVSSAVSAASSVPPELQDADQLLLAAKAAHSVRKPDFYTILISGVDNGNGNSDTNILVAVDAEQNAIYGVNIPRDTKAVIRGKARKFNAAHNIGGVELAADVLSEQLGIPVDYTIEVSLDAFAALVDAIGGVDFYVPLDMDYDDPLQDLAIHFQEGLQHLSGEDALKVVRFRHNNDGTGYGSEDIGRMKTQQDFLKSVARQTLRPANLTKVSEFARIFQKYVKTDLELGELAWLGQQAFSAGADGIQFSTLPGEWRSPYIYLDADAVLELVNAHLNPYEEDRTAEDLSIPS